ncbi:MAG: outer membrane lipoprotein-sorting protein [Verrucomicrobia bacterium]|nr:outer membrane lipoprotein-sorting protein [Verrucomicrobiota bacterium]
MALLSQLVCSAPAAELTESQRQGRELARELASLRPLNSSTNPGVLKIRDGKGRRREVPILIETIRNDPSWESRYHIAATTNSAAQFFSVQRAVDSTSAPSAKLFLQTADTAGRALSLTTGAAMQPLGGSDFWLADLSLVFLDWPEQRVLKKELRRGESCNVLESVNPQPGAGGYTRVVSWVDIDTGGIVHADAYGADNKLLKVFEPKRFEKVNGRWQVKELEIRNEQTDSRTTLVFDRAVE